MTKDVFVSDHPWPRVKLYDHEEIQKKAESGATPWESQQEAQEELPEDALDYLNRLPPEEAEVFWMVQVLGKRQADVGSLLGIAQPTVHHRVSRAVLKLRYLWVLDQFDVDPLVREICASRKHRRILLDLARTQHQSEVGRRHGVNQSTVRWVLTKARNRVERLAREEPDRWRPHLALVRLVEAHTGKVLGFGVNRRSRKGLPGRERRSP